MAFLVNIGHIVLATRRIMCLGDVSVFLFFSTPTRLITDGVTLFCCRLCAPLFLFRSLSILFLVLFFVEQNPWSLPMFIKMHRASHWLYKKLLNQMVLKTDPLIRCDIISARGCCFW